MAIYLDRWCQDYRWIGVLGVLYLDTCNNSSLPGNINSSWDARSNSPRRGPEVGGIEVFDGVKGRH